MSRGAAEAAPSETPSGPAGPAEIAKMRARAFFPADHAAVENGKIYANGAFWALLRFPSFPAVLPTMMLVAVIEIPFHAHQADHALEMLLIDSDDQPAGFEAQGTFRSAPSLDLKHGQAGLVPSVVPVQGLVIRRPGEYSFVLKVDRVELARYPISVIQLAGVPILNFRPVPPSE